MSGGEPNRHCGSQSTSPGGSVVRCELRYDHDGDHSGTFVAFGKARRMDWTHLQPRSGRQRRATTPDQSAVPAPGPTRAAEGLRAKIEAVLEQWGSDPAIHFDQDFAEAIQDSGAWRLSRDLRAALAEADEGEGEHDAFYAESYGDWTVHALPLVVYVPAADQDRDQALALVREVLDEAAFDIRVSTRSAVATHPDEGEGEAGAAGLTDEERGTRFRVEVACDGYANLMDDDVPSEWDEASYQAGAHDAAEAIRGVLLANRSGGAR